MAQYQKFLFDNFVIAGEEEKASTPDETAIPVSEETEPEKDPDQTSLAEETFTPPETPQPAAYSQEELDAAVTQAEEKGYERGFRAADDSGRQSEEQLLTNVNAKLLALVSEVEHYKLQLEQDSLQFAAAVIRKILPSLEQERALAEVENFLSANFPSFRKEAILSFSFNPEMAAQGAGLLGKLADKNDFEGKISVHKDANLGISDVRVEWAEGGVERNTEKMLAKVDVLLENKPLDNQERENG